MGRALIYQLPWVACEGSESINTAGTKYSLSGPTFSWTSAFGSARYLDVAETQPKPEYSPFVLCQLVSFHRELATSNPFGSVVSARLTLSASTVSADLLIAELEFDHFGVNLSPKIYLDDGYRFFSGIYATAADLEELRQARDWSAILFCCLYEYEEGHVVALLLQRTPDPDTFLRIGLASGLEKGWIDQHTVLSNVTII